MRFLSYAREICCVLLFLVLAPVSECLGSARLLEAPPKAPYQKIGDIEVSARCFFFSKGRIKAKLNKKLSSSASKYKADAVANIRYYPDFSQPSFFRRKEYYARGTLIQYTRFPEAQPQTQVR